MAAEFHTTSWDLVMTARDGDASSSRRALEALYEAYWQPIYTFVRRQGNGVDEARDLTQAFFTHLLEKDSLRTVTPAAGRFRAFLLASLKNLLADERRRAKALKRGGGAVAIPLDVSAAESALAVEPAEEDTPETLYEKRWALTILDRTLDRLKEEYEFQGKQRRFEELKVYLTEDKPASYREVALKLEMSEAAMSMAVHRLRKRYGEVLRKEVGGTVAGPEEVDDEIRHLLSLLRS